MFLLGGRIVPLTKSDTRVRPIVVGEYLVKLAAKVTLARVTAALQQKFLGEDQFGVAVPLGMETVIHTIRQLVEVDRRAEEMDAGAEALGVMQLDFQNAYNSISRALIRKALVADPQWSPLLRYFDLRYPMQETGEDQRTPKLALRADDGIMHWIPSREGVQQGDPLGPALFAFGLSEVLRKARELEIQEASEADRPAFTVSYLDDVQMVGSLRDMARRFAWVKRAAEELKSGLVLNIKKCRLWFRREREPRVVLDTFRKHGGDLPEYPELVSSQQGLLILGAPVGSKDYQQQYWKDKVTTEHKALAEALDAKVSSTQIRMLLLRQCMIPMSNFMARTTPPDLVSEAAAEHDKVIRQVLAGMCDSHHGIDDTMWLGASLPLRLGGLGLIRTEDCAPIAYLASTASCAERISSLQAVRRITGAWLGPGEESTVALPPEVVNMWKATMQKLEDMSQTALKREKPRQGGSLDVKEMNKTLASLPDSVDKLLALAKNKEIKLQKTLMQAVHWARFVELFQAQDRRGRGRMLSQCQDGASSFLTCAPFNAALSLTNAEYQYALEKWLGGVPNLDSEADHCTCASARGPNKAEHMSNCHVGGGMITRHNMMVAEVAEMLKTCGVSHVKVEERGKYEEFGNGAPDITAVDYPTSGQNTFVEITVTNPLAAGQAAASTGGFAARKAFLHKRDKYQNGARKEGLNLRTVSIETDGGFHREVGKVIEMAVQQAERKELAGGGGPDGFRPWTTPNPKVYWKQRFAVQLRRAQFIMAETIIDKVDAFNTGQEARLEKYKKAVMAKAANEAKRQQQQNYINERAKSKTDKRSGVSYANVTANMPGQGGPVPRTVGTSATAPQVAKAPTIVSNLAPNEVSQGPTQRVPMAEEEMALARDLCGVANIAATQEVPMDTD